MILHNKLQVSPFFLAEQELLRRAFVVLQHLTADPRCLDGPFWNSAREIGAKTWEFLLW